ncbi:hypothetical protein BDB00DRAFT_830013 [Zychaea mexicana]|uniref:uncharacterized protein n=1 Tax=Zychaea mexicana TaxID=64656 RepID=UPI0022FE5E32|nr:uncharacterized protein BDB00DRAFT_830013 [Zychaea mexicana]KAI9492056.1 hypothetical protein BDB00DRAFT_830013 [Zychaea mexicana]
MSPEIPTYSPLFFFSSSKTCTTLEAKLAALKTSLLDVDQELSDENCRMDRQSIEYDRSLFATLELARKIFAEDHDTEQPSLCGDTHGFNDYLSVDKRLYDNLSHALSKLRDQLPFLEANNNATNDAGDAIENLVADYMRNELSHIKTKAQQKGLEARVQSLERDLKKLKGLPQVIPILKSSIEGFGDTIKKEAEEQRRIQHRDIEPLLSKLADATIRTPLTIAKTSDDYELLQHYSANLDVLLDTLKQQRAMQKLVSYAYQVDNHYHQQRISVLDALSSEAAEENDNYKQLQSSISMDKRKPSLSSDAQLRDEIIIAQIDDLLCQAKLDSLPGLRRRSFQGSSILTKLNAILHYEKKWTEQWSNNFNSTLDAACALDESKEGLMDSLYEHSHTRDNLNMMPSSYTELQSDLELRTQELEDTLADLENATKVDDKFPRKKQLFSTFFTDPNAFGELLRSSRRVSQPPPPPPPS